MKSKPSQFLSLLVVATLFVYPVQLADAASEDDLEEQIEEKNKELQSLSKEIIQTQSRIVGLQGEAQTLSGAISAINSQISRVNYGIRSSEVNIEKLALELESLGYELEDVNADIDTKQVALAEVMRKVQQNDGQSLLEVLLKHNTLADSVFELQSLSDLQDNLNIKVAQLASLQVALAGNIDQTSVKKSELEDEHVTLKGRKNILSDQQEEKDRLLAETKNEESLYQARLAKLRDEQQKILEEKKLLPELPEDLMAMMRKAVIIRKHMEANKQDMTALRGLQFTESKIKRLAKYYKKKAKIPADWKYDPSSVKIYTD